MCFYLFLLRPISLLIKYVFILRYEAWVNTLRASSFIENFPQISAKPIAFQRNLLRKLPRNRPFFTNRFSAELASQNSREIGRFFREFVPENPVKFDFFSATYQKPSAGDTVMLSLFFTMKLVNTHKKSWQNTVEIFRFWNKHSIFTLVTVTF